MEGAEKVREHWKHCGRGYILPAPYFTTMFISINIARWDSIKQTYYFDSLFSCYFRKSMQYTVLYTYSSSWFYFWLVSPVRSAQFKISVNNPNLIWSFSHIENTINGAVRGPRDDVNSGIQQIRLLCHERSIIFVTSSGSSSGGTLRNQQLFSVSLRSFFLCQLRTWHNYA